MTTQKSIQPYRSAAHNPQLRLVDQSKMFDLQAPYSEDSEEALIASVITDPSVFATVSRIIKGSDFFMIRHEMIWHTLTRLRSEGLPIDNYTILIEGLKQDKYLDDIGGPVAITRLLTIGAVSAQAEFYAQMVLRAAIRRRLMYHADQLKALAVDESLSVGQVITSGYEQFRQATSRYSLTQMQTAFELVNEDMDRLEARNFADPVYGVPSGFKTFDNLSDGFLPRFLYVGIAPTTHGKSAFARQTAVNAARLGGRVAYVTTEESAADVIKRMLAAEAGIMPNALNMARLTQEEVGRYQIAAGRIGNAPITFIDDSKSDSGLITPSYIRSSIETLRDQSGVDLVVVDYGQDIDADDPDIQGDTYKRNTATAIAMHKLSRELNVPVLLMVQANRAASTLKNKLDLLHYIEGSGKYGQKGDFVFSMWHEFKDDPACVDPNLVRLKINKNKINGLYGEVFLQLHPSTKLTEMIRQNVMGEAHYFGTGRDVIGDEV